MAKNEQWDTRLMLDQSGKVAIVTGAGSGLGFEIARALAEKKAKVVVAVRDPTKGSVALEKIRKENSRADVEVMELDLAGLASIRRFTEEFKKRYSRLDLLINNAGVMACPYGKTADGFELQFGTNHLGHFALTVLLIDILKKVPGSRVVTVSSGAHSFGMLDFDDLNWEKRRYNRWQAYGDSKLANLYFTKELQRRLDVEGTSMLSVAAHPGWAATELQRHQGWLALVNRFFAQSPEMGALPMLYAATAPDVHGGEYFGPDGRGEVRGYPVRVRSSKRSRDMTVAGELWEISEKMTGIKW
ncbi:SDR family NAD(P)-dependent oxidoreductase [Prosthecochloris sp.]|uniref:SDR family NAD(P)-dependent oxidoreductase n=1 Tax=Prosthecochloris sp. TaxID=290513 RepID=UPI00257B8937|nr:SDR family NAD(P)-dependent oxidoreductase [Prosthecochloris sp.]